MKLLTRSGGAFVAAALLLGACGSDGGDSNTDSGSDDGGASVAVKDDFFEPKEITVAKGERVTWTWGGTNPHNVSSDEFSSKIQTDGTYSFTFEDAGTIDYICTVHPSMKASVTVTDE